MKKTTAITSIAVFPKDTKRVRYVLNGSEDTHVARIEKLQEMIVNLCPSVAGSSREYLDQFLPFLIFVQEEVIQVLDYQKEEVDPKKMIQEGFLSAIKNPASARQAAFERFGASSVVDDPRRIRGDSTSGVKRRSAPDGLLPGIKRG